MDVLILPRYSVDGAFRGVFYEVARGQGDALFSNPTDFYPMATALPNGFDWMQWNEYEIADVDGDGRGDLTILQPYSVDGAYRGVFYEVGFGNGDGTFRPSPGFASVATTLPNGSEWMEWTDYSMGDVDADGDADLGIFQPYSAGGAYRGVFVEIALGNGDGTFGPSLGFLALPTTLPNGFEWMQWNEYELGDVDGDGRADVVVFQPFSVGGAYRGVFYEVAFGNGDGTFQPLTEFASIATSLPNGPEWMEWTDYSLGDTTGDGRADIAILQPYSVDGAFRGVFYEIAPSNGDGTFGPVIDRFRSVATTLPNGPEWMEWAQFELGRVLD